MRTVGVIIEIVVLVLGVVFLCGCYVLQEDRHRRRVARSNYIEEVQNGSSGQDQEVTGSREVS